MEKRVVRGCTVKITGECNLVIELAEILEGLCDVVHTSDVRMHAEDDGCHLFINVEGVRTD